MVLTVTEREQLYASMRPALEKLELQRVAAVKFARKMLVGLLVTACVTILGTTAWLVVTATSGEVPWLVFLFAGVMIWAVLGTFIYQLFAGTRITAYRTAYKQTVIDAVLARIQPSMAYQPDAGIARRTFDDSRLFHERAHRYHCEDGFHGTIGKTSLSFSEVRAYHRKRQGKRTRYVQYFGGLFFEADFHKHFRSSVFVLPDVAESALGFIGKKLQGFRPLLSHQLVYMEDPEFEQNFVVYGTDQVDARYVLSSAMLRRIVELKERWKSDIRLRFHGSIVQVAIPCTENLFEPTVYASALSEQRIASLAHELDFCFQIVNDLSLNTRIWSKE